MDMFWEKMTPDEKCDQLRERLEMLAVEVANDQRRLNDRLVKLEQAHETFQQQHSRKASSPLRKLPWHCCPP